MCRICGSKDEVKHFSFYCFGSEGVNLCINCQIQVSNFIKALGELSGRVKLNTIKAYKGV